MSEALDIVPENTKVDTGIRKVEGIAEGLADILADTYRLVFKTHAYHWNVEGPLFYGLHNLTEEQYEDMFDAADEIAERIRALGKLAPMSFSAIAKKSVIEDLDGMPSAGEMIEDLVAGHERIAHRLHALAEMSEDRKDFVTHDLATERAAFHEKAAWMLRSIGAT